MKTTLLILLTAFRVAFVGDPQVDNAKELEYVQKSIYSELRTRKDLDLVVILGDLVNENPSLIAPSEASLDSLGCPWVRVNGNHDGPDPKADTTFIRGGIRFILMDNVRRLRKGGYEGGLCERQKQWLDSVMKATPSKIPSVVCTHIPVSQSKGLDSLANIMAGHKDVLYVCGHTHSVDRHILERGCEEVIAGAACGTWWRGKKDTSGVKCRDGVPYALMNCGAPRGYFVAEFKPGSCTQKAGRWYSLRYKAVGYDSQWSAHLAGDKLYINIFGGSREGCLTVRTGSGWKEAKHCYTVAPEVMEIIAANNATTREYRKAHRDEFIPMRRLPSPHVWVIEDLSESDISALESALSSGNLRLRYSDRSMKIR